MPSLSSAAALALLSVAATLSSAASARSGPKALPGPCDDGVYCATGPNTILHTVQMARIYNDSKTFVDKPMSQPRATVIRNFEILMQDTGSNPTVEQVRAFVDENFSAEGTEFEDWDPEDWHDNPVFLEKITDEKYKSLGEDLHRRWKDLGRKIRGDVASEPDRTSLIALSHPFVVPGGRFREMYYWDSYWTILGLLLSEMEQTVKGMLQNFADLVDLIGLIPNGNRVYYQRRSQPPLFIAMVDAYHKATGDNEFVRNYISVMDREFQFWMENRTVSVVSPASGKTHSVAIYNVQVDGPRPESYFEDYRDAQHFETDEEETEFYVNIKSGCESGWDFSSKWFIDSSGEISTALTDIKTRHIVPVELNSYLCANSHIMADLHDQLGNTEKADEYRQTGEDLAAAVDDLLWNAEEGAWFDFDITNAKQRIAFYPSNLSPLWAECYSQTRLKEKVSKAVKYLKRQDAFAYPGGVPTSMVRSGQQWDFSNAWPPLQELLITGLERSGDAEAADLAFQLASKWMLNIHTSYQQSNFSMFEKYDVEQIGLPGGGGEYDVQEGFGWTNGVVMHLLDKYGDRLSSDAQVTPPPTTSSAAGLVSGLSSVIVVIVAQTYLPHSLLPAKVHYI